MKKLEHIAQKMFADFAYKRTGIWADWSYLSPKRRLEWVKEVENTFQTCLNILKEEVKPYLQPSSGNSSYEKGFMAGQSFEARRIDGKIENLKKELIKQVETLEDMYVDNNEE